MSETTDHANVLRDLAEHGPYEPPNTDDLMAAADEIDQLRARVAELEAQVARLTPPPRHPRPLPLVRRWIEVGAYRRPGEDDGAPAP